MSTSETTQRKTEATRLPYFPEEDPIDGRAENETDRRAESRYRARVLSSVADYMKGKRKRHGC